METEILCRYFKLYFSYICCLNPLEAITLNALIAIRVGALVDFVTKEYFDQAWSNLGGVVGDARYGMFVLAYHMRLEEVDVDGEMIEVYFIDDQWWFNWLIWVGACDALNCDDGCFEIEYGK